MLCRDGHNIGTSYRIAHDIYTRASYRWAYDIPYSIYLFHIKVGIYRICTVASYTGVQDIYVQGHHVGVGRICTPGTRCIYLYLCRKIVYRGELMGAGQICVGVRHQFGEAGRAPGTIYMYIYEWVLYIDAGSM